MGHPLPPQHQWGWREGTVPQQRPHASCLAGTQIPTLTQTATQTPDIRELVISVDSTGNPLQVSIMLYTDLCAHCSA